MISANGNISFVVGRLIPNTVLVVNKDPQQSGAGLSANESEQVAKLQQRDQKVRSHENAHTMASQGTTVGSPDYDVQIGPDNKPYAINGRVHVRVKADINDKDDALAAADLLRKTAQAPVDSSGVDAQAGLLAAEIETRALANDNQKRAENENFETNIDQAFLDGVDITA